MIQIKNVRKNYLMGDVTVEALRGVSLTVEHGEFLAIMGPSGSGKSTLMHILGLLDVPTSGSYNLLGKEISKLSEDELAAWRGRVVGFVFQQFNLLSRTTALDNVALPTYYTGNGFETATAEKLLEMVGLGSRKFHKPNELSGGQQQRVAIARSLINSPKLLFADEPTGNLDSASQTEIMELLKTLNEQGITIVLVTHEEEIASYAKRIIRMRDGVVQSDEVQRRTPASSGEKTSHKIEPDSAVGSITKATFHFRAFINYFRQAWIALLANKVRSGLSMLGITIGVAAVIAMLAIGRGAKLAVEAQLSSLGSNLLVLSPGSHHGPGGVSLGAGAVTRFTRDDAREIAQSVPTVKSVSASVNGRAQVVYLDKNWNTQILGTTPDYASMHAFVPKIGHFFEEEDTIKRARVAVVGMTVVRNIFGDTNPIGEYIKINRVPFQVIGILPEKGQTGWRDQDDIIMIPLNTAMYRLLGKTYVDSIDMEVLDSTAMDDTTQAVKDLIIRKHHLPPSLQDSFEIRNLADIQAALSSSSKILSMLLAAIAAISLLVGGIGIMNIMLVSVTERTREIGLRKAIGARRTDILAQFLVESLTTGFVGGTLGIVIGVLVTLTISFFAHWTTALSTDAMVGSALFSAGVGVLFGLWPARKASLLNPIEALRYE